MKNLNRCVYLAIACFVSLNALGAEERQVELNCKVHETGKGLDCTFLDEGAIKPLTDQDLPTFINRATKGAYLTVRSKKGLERTYSLDPNGAEFKRFYELQKSNASARELGQAKLDIFAAIEQKVIKISDALDTAPNSDLVKSDPSVANAKFKSEVSELEAAKRELERKCTKGPSDQELETLTADRRNLGHYLSTLMRTMQEKGTCTDSFAIHTEKDGSVGFEQINSLSKLFQEKCRREKTSVAPACIAKDDVFNPEIACASFVTNALARSNKNVSCESAPGKGKETASRSLSSVLHQKYAEGKLKENALLNCDSKYLQGPFVISSGKPDAQATCYGLSQCGSSGRGKEKTRVACGAEVSGGHFICPSPEKCLKNGEVLIFGKEITVQ